MEKNTLSELDAQAEKIVAKYEQKRAALLMLLHLGQDKIGFVSPAVEAWASRWTEVPVVHVHEVVTFYSMYHRSPVGCHHLRFCMGTSCMLRGSEKMLGHLAKRLGVKNGETTADGKVSLEEAECLCACEVAPMMQVDGKYYGDLTEEKVDKIINGLK